MSKVKELLSGLETENGYSPVSGVLNTLTFGKSIPLYIVLSLLIALVCEIAFCTLTWMFIDSIVGCIFLTVLSLILFVYQFFTGTIFLVVYNFVDNIEHILLGTLEPIEKVYEKWTASGKLNMSKKEFVSIVLKEEIIPGVLNNIYLGSLKEKVQSYISIDIDVNELEGESEVDISSGIKRGLEKSKQGVTKPYNMSFKILGGLSLLVILFHLI